MLEDADNGLTAIGRQAMALLLAEHHRLTTQIKTFDERRSLRLLTKQPEWFGWYPTKVSTLCLPITSLQRRTANKQLTS